MTEVKMLKGIDISNNQGEMTIENIDCDFVIAKSTQGIGFVDKYCDDFIQQAKEAKKLIGFYHFAEPNNDPVREADFWIQHTENYWGHYLPVLDIEKEPSNKNKSVVDWCYKFLKRCIDRMGIKPVVYMSQIRFEWKYDWKKVIELDCGLWCAAYPYKTGTKIRDYNMSQKLKPKLKHWPFMCMWQFTSEGQLNGYTGNLDCNFFYGDKDTWYAYSGTTAEKEEVNKDNEKNKQLQAENEKLLKEKTELYIQIQNAYDHYKKGNEILEKLLNEVK